MEEDVKEIKRYVKALFWLFLIQIAFSWIMGTFYYLKLINYQ